ncbi:MAG: SAM-dependent methyltransferase [Burkholderiales bacterium]|nr:SAM-dependent methyltransferase [Burkholderiales bacterium]
MARLEALIAGEIERERFLPFQRFMQLALYAPGLGYYAAGATKLGAAGDFVTAPELSPLFGAALARQVAAIMTAECNTVVELGAGSGRLAAGLLAELARLDRLPGRYCIIELSADLRARQQALLRHALPTLCERVQWLERMPDAIRGIVLANEVLDAVPVALVRTAGADVLELGVVAGCGGDAFAWSARPARGELAAAARELDLPDGYTTEIHLLARALVRTIGAALSHGALLVIDYGFPRREYYHPQRAGGTLMCHYRHHSHADPLALVGLQDITSHLDFSALAQAALDSGMTLLGYATQAHFLINCGLLELLAALDPNDVHRYAPACAAVQTLVGPAEMGELFKVIAFGRGIDRPLLGFRSGNRAGML